MSNPKKQLTFIFSIKFKTKKNTQKNKWEFSLNGLINQDTFSHTLPFFITALTLSVRIKTVVKAFFIHLFVNQWRLESELLEEPFVLARLVPEKKQG